MDPAEKLTITERLKQLLLPAAEDARVCDVRIGLGYTAVRLADQRTGVAYTFTHAHTGGCELFIAKRPLSGRPAADLISLVTAGHPIEAAVGMATCNAVAAGRPPNFQEGDVFESLALEQHDRVCMVGNFAPIAGFVREQVAELLIFEQIDAPRDGILPAADLFQHLPDAQVLLLTATALINHTADAILARTVHCREVVVLGASAPLIPEAFAHVPVTLVSGVRVVDAEAVMQVVSEGGGMKAFRPYLQKVNLRIRE